MTREAPRECPHCEEVTMPNRLPDSSLVCSCPAMRALPSGPVSLGAAKPPAPTRR